MATKTKLTRIDKRKRLEALFDRGAYVRFNSDEGNRPVINPEVESESDLRIWVAPPSPLQREMAVREAQAGRARVMIEARDEANSTTWLTIHNFVRGLSTDELITYIVDLDDSDYLTQARREVLLYPEWEDFNALRDAMRQYEESGANEDDEEWAPLLERDRVFGEQVMSRADELREDARAGYALMPREKLEENALEKRVEQAGSAAFMTQYEEWMLFYSCRDDEDHGALYFESLDDMKSLPVEVQGALAVRLTAFIQESSEAKN